MACPKCGNDTIEVLDENAGGTVGRVCGGFAVMCLGFYLLVVNLIFGFLVISGGIGMMCAKKTKTVKCKTCGYTQVIPQ